MTHPYFAYCRSDTSSLLKLIGTVSNRNAGQDLEMMCESLNKDIEVRTELSVNFAHKKRWSTTLYYTRVQCTAMKCVGYTFVHISTSR